MNLPERRAPQNEPSAAKPGLRPRPIQTRDVAVGTHEGGSLLHFSCPACLRMIAATRGLEVLACPLCEAQVVPPRLATGDSIKGRLPVRGKSGRGTERR